MSKRLIWALIATASSISYCTPYAYGDTYHFKNLLIGERASGMGGTFIAISDDPTGIYYNPAGTVYGFENYISASANTFNTDTRTIQGIAPGKNYTLNSQILTPMFFGFTQSWGKNKFGFAIVVPDAEHFDQDDNLTNLNSQAGASSSLLREIFNQTSTYLFGPSYAFEIGSNASIGFSLMGSMLYGNITNNQLVTFNPLAGATINRYYIQNNYLHYTVFSLVPKFGLQYMPSANLSFGFTLSKSMILSNSANTRAVQTPTTNSSPNQQNGDVNNDIGISTSSVTFQSPSPVIVGLGSAYFFSKSFLVAADLSFYTADPTLPDVTAPTFNISTGMELYLSQTLAIRTGIYTNRANTPGISSTAMNQPDHIDMAGLSMGISLLKQGSSLTLGTNYSFGTGQSQSISNSTAIQTVNETALGFTISGSYQL